MSRIVDLRDSVNTPPVITPEVRATTTIVFDAAAFPSSPVLGYLLQALIGATEVLNTFKPEGFATNADWMLYVKAAYEAAGFGVVIASLNMTLTAPVGSGINFNSLINIVQSRDENANVYTDALTSSPAFTGGVAYSEKRYLIRLKQ